MRTSWCSAVRVVTLLSSLFSSVSFAFAFDFVINQLGYKENIYTISGYTPQQPCGTNGVMLPTLQTHTYQLYVQTSLQGIRHVLGYTQILDTN